MYWGTCRANGDVNVIIAMYREVLMGDVQVGFEKGTVFYDRGLHGWGLKAEPFVTNLGR